MTLDNTNLPHIKIVHEMRSRTEQQEPPYVRCLRKIPRGWRQRRQQIWSQQDLTGRRASLSPTPAPPLNKHQPAKPGPNQYIRGLLFKTPPGWCMAQATSSQTCQHRQSAGVASQDVDKWVEGTVKVGPNTRCVVFRVPVWSFSGLFSIRRRLRIIPEAGEIDI